MKHLTLILLLGLIAVVAYATPYNDVEGAREIVSELRSLQSTRDVNAVDVQEITVFANVRVGPTNQVYKFTFKPDDTGWNAFLSCVNTMVVNRISTLKAKLGAMGVTGVPD